METRGVGTGLALPVRRSDLQRWERHEIRRLMIGCLPHSVIRAPSFTFFFQFCQEIDGLSQASYEINPSADLGLVRRAADLAFDQHISQRRASGEPYVGHPLAVAEILVYRFGLGDVEMVAAALLHDLVEDQGLSVSYIQQHFGGRVALLVDGLSKIKSRDKDESLTKTYTKFIRYTDKDLAIAVLKLADRLHNMQTLGVFQKGKQARIARETLNIYVPIARALGIWEIADELEDLAYSYADPDGFSLVKEQVDAGRRAEAHSPYAPARNRILEGLVAAGFEVRMEPWRQTYRWHTRQQADLDHLIATEALTIILGNEDTRTEAVYACLPHLYALYHPNRGETQDYIGDPLPRYRAFHVNLRVPGVGILEVRIMTPRTERLAKQGILAVPLEQWRNQRRVWLSYLLSIVGERGIDSAGIVQGIQQFSINIVVVSPKGREYKLPLGARAIDYACAVHPGLALRATGARINGVRRPLDYTLRHGDQVEILGYRDGQGAVPDYFDRYPLMALPVTRTRFRKMVRRLLTGDREFRAETGRMVRTALDEVLSRYSLSMKQIGETKLFKNTIDAINYAIRGYHIRNLETLLDAIALGWVSVLDVVNTFMRLNDIRLAERRKDYNAGICQLKMLVPDEPKMFGRVATAIGEANINIVGVPGVTILPDGRARLVLDCETYWFVQARQLQFIGEALGTLEVVEETSKPQRKK